jgi:hypothetical protein
MSWPFSIQMLGTSSSIANRIAGFLAAALISTSAFGDQVILICETGQANDLGPATIFLNEAQSSVIVKTPIMRNGSLPPIEGSTLGPLTAKFSPEAITFSFHENQRDTVFTINRLTGTMAREVSQFGQKFYFQWACHVGKAQF